MTIIKHGNPDRMICAFTFDDGPTFLDLEMWLQALEKNQIVGTFFFTGEWMDRYPRLARELVVRGHELAPHTYHHRRMAEVSKHVFYEELMQTELAYQDATGLPCPNFMRFPYRSYSEQSLDWLTAFGYVDVEGIDSGDWTGAPSDEIMRKLVPATRNGAIFVFHANDIARGTPEAVELLGHIVSERGLAPVLVSDLLRSTGIVPQYREWTIAIQVPGEMTYSTEDWMEVGSLGELRRLAAAVSDWGIPHIHDSSEKEARWLSHLIDACSGHSADRPSMCYTRVFCDHYWAYAHAEVQGDTLVLLDFATREFTADALVYVLRWAAKKAAEFGCSRVTAKREMRRIRKLCEQMGWEARFIPGEWGRRR